MVNVNVPAAVGVPARIRVLRAKFKPGGAELPAAKLQTYGDVPPVATTGRGWLYADPTAPGGSADVTERLRTGGLTATENVLAAVTPALSVTCTVNVNVPIV
jgi:hypothetical protein